MLKWIQSYLFNRRARVLTNLAVGRSFYAKGVPQGDVLSPTLFLVFTNDLVSELHRGVNAALYADDLVLWCTEEHASTANYSIQQDIDQLTAWTEDWCVTVNKNKSSTTLFTLSPKKQASPIKIGTHTLESSHLSWCNFRQETDMEAAYPTCRGKDTQEAGNHAQTSRNNMRS